MPPPNTNIAYVVVTACSQEYEVEVNAHITAADGEREEDQKISGAGNESSRPIYFEDGDTITLTAKVVGTYKLDEEQGSVSMEPVEEPPPDPGARRKK